METETKKIEAESIPPLAQPPNDVALGKPAAADDETKALVVVESKFSLSSFAFQFICIYIYIFTCRGVFGCWENYSGKMNSIC